MNFRLSSSSSKLLGVKSSEKSKSPVSQKRRLSKNRNDFIKIRSSKYQTEDHIERFLDVLVDSLSRLKDADPCNCTVSNACVTRSCSHRSAFEECTQTNCKWHDQCQNRRMGNNEAIHQLQIFDTEKCGRGVRSAIEIYPGQLICEYVGEVVKLQNYQLRTLLRSEDMPRFGVHLSSFYVVDATQKGNIARFINHSCEPNCEMQRWIVNGYYRLGIFAKKKIEEGEELTYDYSMFVQMEPPQRCECGSRQCKGFLPCQLLSKTSTVDEPQKLTKNQTALVRKTRVLLLRNLRKFSKNAPARYVPLYKKYPELSSFLLTIYGSIVQHAETKEKIAKRRTTQLSISMRRVNFLVITR